MNYEKYAIADIHLHLDGSLSPEAVIAVAQKENIKLPTYSKEELVSYLQAPEDCPSLNELLKRFDIPNLVLQSKFGLSYCTLDLLKRISDDGVKYAEIRMAPQLSTAKGLSQEEVIQTMVEALKEGEKKFGIKSNLIVCMMRGENTKEANIETVELAKKYRNDKVVAVDIAGAEALFPNELFAFEFALVKKYGLNLTIHAGEASGPESVKSAIEFGADRIGHGIHAIADKKVCELLKTLEICLEICPKSNLDTKAIKSYDELPVRQFLDMGIKVSINSDDMTVCNTSVKKEYATLARLGYKENELREFALNTINASFADEATKQQLKKFII